MNISSAQPVPAQLSALDELVRRLASELHHPDLAPPLSSLAVRGVALATGWTLEVWLDRLADLQGAVTDPSEDAVRTLRADAAQWQERLKKLRSFLATAGHEATHIDADAANDAEAQTLFGAQGQAIVEQAAAWFASLSEQPGDDAVVAVHRVSKRYGDVVAVDDVSVTIRRGEVFGLLGPNSAGKTTLVECMEGIRTPDAGSIVVLGRRFGDAGKQIRTRIGVQLQTTGFYERLTVRETLEFYASFYPTPANVTELMSRLDIEGRAKVMVRDLSGGIRQRLSLGVALVSNPELIFLDEPTTGLDPQARHVVWDVVRSLQRQGLTVILTTHYMDEAEQLCDRVAFMAAGRLLLQGPPRGLIRNHIGETLVDVAAYPELDEARAAALPGALSCRREGERLILRSEDPAALLREILALPHPPTEARIRRGTLEDVFLQVNAGGQR